MSSITSQLISGQVQTSTGTGNNTTTATPASNTITTDVDIFAVGNSINPTNFTYDGQTVLMINSTLNPNANVVKAQYFDPVYGGVPGGFGFTDWNFDLVPNSYLNGSFSSSALLSEPTYLFNNLQPITTALGQFTLDIENGNAQTVNGSSNQTLFFSLTSQPYVCYQGSFYSTPTQMNVVPGYSSNNSDNFLFTSNYYVQQKNEIIIVQLVFTVSNTNSLNANNVGVGLTSGAPTISVIVYNKVISKEALASLATGSTGDALKTKVYTAGPIPLQYTQNGTPFNPQNPSYSINNNVPIIIAPGYQKQYVTMPIIYVHPTPQQVGSTTVYYPNYLNPGNVSSPSNPGYQIVNNLPIANPLAITPPANVAPSPFGHFVVGVSFSSDYADYQPGSAIYAEVLIKNIWRSPLAVYQSYQAFSTNDMATKQVVLLFGKTFNGGTFLVTNSGTPISMIDNYAVTSLRNFMSIMRAVFAYFDGSVSLVDYFINTNVVQQINALSNANIQVLTLQPLLDGSISNPPTVLTCPNMYYLLLKTPNTVNMSVDPTSQVVFGQNIGASYFGLPNSLLCGTGDCRYYSSDLNLLSVSDGQIFGNSLYAGLNTINNQQFYTLIIMPEALFNGVPLSVTNNVLNVYSTPSTLFYINTTTNTSSQFVPRSASITSSGTSSGTSSNFTITPTYNISKLVLTASNVKII